MARRRIDWEAVARDYAVSEAPVAEIARKHGLVAINIHAQAKREGWARSAPAGATKVKKPVPRTPARKTRQPAYAPSGDVNSGRALSRMMNIVNRLADELERHIDQPGDAAMSATEKKGAADTLRGGLLADIAEVFRTTGQDRISTADLIEALCADDAKPYATWARSKPMTPRHLANKLADYRITPKTIRIGGVTAKGFLLADFADTFSRYLPVSPDTPILSVTPSQPAETLGFSIIYP